MVSTIILERIHSSGLSMFKSFSNVKEFYDKSRSEILEVIKNFEVIVIKSTIKIDHEFLNSSDKIKVIARAGTGLDNINQELLKKRKIKLISIPKENSVATAEYILCMILFLSKKISLIQKMINNNDFSRHKIESVQLDSATIGVIGLGSVGLEVVKRVNPFNCKVLVFDNKIISKNIINKFNITTCQNLLELLKKSNFIILCASLNDESENLINAENYNFIQKGSYLINCARAELVNQDILLKGLNEGVFDAVAIDLISPEPVYKKKTQALHPLVNHPKVFYSPHVAAMTDVSQRKISTLLASKVKKFLLDEVDSIL